VRENIMRIPQKSYQKVQTNNSKKVSRLKNEKKKCEIISEP
jgi:hypothetical protein